MVEGFLKKAIYMRIFIDMDGSSGIKLVSLGRTFKSTTEYITKWLGFQNAEHPYSTY